VSLLTEPDGTAEPPHHPGMDRRRFLLTSLAGALVGPLGAEAQKAGKVPTVAILRWVRDPEQEKALRDALRANGYVDGRNIVIHERSADGRSDRGAQHAGDFVHLGADVIVAAGTPAVQAAWRATRSIPIVMSGSADPVASGFAASLARPGGNVTGNSWNLPALAGKRLQLLREALPNASRVAFLGSRRDPAAQLFVDETQSAARQLGVHVHVEMVNETKDFDAALSNAVRARVSALIVQPIFGYGETLRIIVKLTDKYRLPSISDFPEFASSGGLLSYGPHRREAVQRVAAYVDMILKGAKPGDLPIQEPTTFDLVINLNTAKALGLTIPPSLLARADQVIE
jgi:putative tryptophan/tyrosine transport system substrate-binding protein